MPHSPSDLEQIYKNRFALKTAYRRRVWRILTEYFARWIPPNATVLDLGCGYCEFINQVEAKIKYAMDLSPEVVSRAERGIQVLQQDCSEAWTIAPGSLDVVFTSNFFEHLATKSHLERTLVEAYRCLKDGGCLIALGPNIKYLLRAASIARRQDQIYTWTVLGFLRSLSSAHGTLVIGGVAKVWFLYPGVRRSIPAIHNVRRA